MSILLLTTQWDNLKLSHVGFYTYQACDFLGFSLISGFVYESLFASKYSWKKWRSNHCIQTSSFLFVWSL